MATGRSRPRWRTRRPATAPTPAPNRPAGNAGAPAPGTPTPGTPTTGGQPPAGLPNLANLGLGGAGGDPNPRPYAQVITPRAKSKKGVFDVHQVGSRLYFELPAKELGRDFVVTTVLAGTPAGIGINGTLGPDRVVRFERRENRIFMRDINFNNVATDSLLSTRRAMSLIEFYPIIAAFNVESYGKDSAAVIEVTRMFTGGIQEFAGGGQRVNVDASRSFIERFAAFSRNVNVTASQTFTRGAAGGIAIPGLNLGGPGGATTEAYTFSLVRLTVCSLTMR